MFIEMRNVKLYREKICIYMKEAELSFLKLKVSFFRSFYQV